MMATIDTPARFEAMRHAMVASQLRTSGVDDPRVIGAMARVPRESFVPAEIAPLAYRDRALALGDGRAMNPPLATGLLLNQARVRVGERVLLIGMMTDYTAAVLHELGAIVVAVEAPGERLRGAAQGAPYDLLMIDAAVEELPTDLAEQVRAGGRIVTGIVDRGVTRLASGERTGGGFGLTDFADVECVVLPEFARPRGFTF